ncbi:MAG: guanine deaminase [Bacteroidia bacterium]
MTDKAHKGYIDDVSAVHQSFMKEAIRLSRLNMQTNAGGPFGAVVVKDGVIVGRGNNRVTSTNDPTAHAEIVAIRDACKTLNSFQLDGCVIYTSCEPCPMCLGAIYWARPEKVYYACTREDAAGIEFDDAFIYDELRKPISGRMIPMIQFGRDEAIKVFEIWKNKADKTEY